jgi:hypothetical protein
LGIEVRAGLHVGELEEMRPKVAGLAVVTAARLASLASAGEVLVSSTVSELVAGSGLDFEDRGIHQLKGVPGPRHVFAVTVIDGTPRSAPLNAAEAERRREAIEPPPRRNRGTWRIGAGAAAVALVAALVVVVLAASQSAASIHVQPQSLVEINPTNGRIVADIPVARPNGSQIAIVPPHEVWVLSQTQQVITIVNALTGKTQTIGVFSGQNGRNEGFGITYADGLVWVSGGNDQVATIDPRTRQQSGALLHVPGAPALMATGFGRVWIGRHDAEVVDGIDPATRKVAVKSDILSAVNGIGVGEGAVWIADYFGVVFQVNPSSEKSRRIYVSKSANPGLATVATGFGSAWVSAIGDGSVYRIDPALHRIVKRIRVGKPDTVDYASDIAPAAGSMWVVSPGSKTIVQIDPGSNAVKSRIPLPDLPEDLSVGYGRIWVTVGGTTSA